MKNLIVTALPYICLLSAVMSAVASKILLGDGHSVDLEISPGPIFELGVVRQNSTATATFVLRNVTDNVIELLSIQPSCSCTVANVDEDTIPAGGTSQITIGYRSSSRCPNCAQRRAALAAAG